MNLPGAAAFADQALRVNRTCHDFAGAKPTSGLPRLIRNRLAAVSLADLCSTFSGRTGQVGNGRSIKGECMMKRDWIASIVCLAALSTSACNRQSEDVPGNETVAANEDAAAEPLNAETGELPPMISRSPAYRCTDGNALYVDVLTDENAVMVRDTRADVPVRLTRSSADEPFTGEGRSLSGRGSEISYSSPERPGQTCREAEV